MRVKNLKPNPAVEKYVERILVIEHDQVITPFSLPLFANGQPTLLFKSTKGTIGNSTASYLTLFGQTIIPETLQLFENFTLISYFFKPHSLLSIFGAAPTQLTDHPIDLDQLAPKKTYELEQRLLNADTIDKMVSLLDNFITYLISQSKPDNSIITYAATKIAQDPSKEILVHLQNELHITERTFQRTFEKNIGIAPNVYRRVCQFNAAFQQLNHRKFSKLSDIAYKNGYSDQSHFIRAFREFTHLTPNIYLNQA